MKARHRRIRRDLTPHLRTAQLWTSVVIGSLLACGYAVALAEFARLGS